MSRLKKALIRVGAVRIEADGTLTPTHGRAARSCEYYDAQAKERQHEGQKSGGRGNKKLGGKSTTKNTKKSRDAAGKAFGVVYSGAQLLLGDQEGVTIFQSTASAGSPIVGGLRPVLARSRDARVVRTFRGPRPDRGVASPSTHRNLSKGVKA